ncbi:MAG: methyltransferase domain-containing protein, partial [Myxococcota bacterium]
MSDQTPGAASPRRTDLFSELAELSRKPKPFEFYTAEELWTGEHTSRKMLGFHLNDALELSSRSSDFIDRSVEWVASQFRVDQGARVADFGCGPGLYANRLAKRGASVTGIDFSARSIRHARAAAEQAGVEVNYLRQNYLESKLDGRFDVILMIMCDFCALSPQQRRLVLQEFYRLLQPDGRLVFDVYSHSAYAGRTEIAIYERNLLDGFWSGEPYYGFLNTFKYENEKVVLDKYTIVEASSVRTVFNWLQYFSPESLAQELSSSGLRVESLLSDVAGASYSAGGPEFAVVVKR